MKQDLALEFCRNQNKDVSILTEAHINHDQKQHRRNKWLGPFLFSPEDSHTKRLHALLHPSLEGVIEVDTDPKRRFVSFKVTPCNDIVLSVYTLSGHNTKDQLARRNFFEGLQNYMENKCEGNKNKIILREFSFTMDKMDRDGGNETKILCRCGSHYTLSKVTPIMVSRIYREGRNQILLSSPTTIAPLSQDSG